MTNTEAADLIDQLREEQDLTIAEAIEELAANLGGSEADWLSAYDLAMTDERTEQAAGIPTE